MFKYCLLWTVQTIHLKNICYGDKESFFEEIRSFLQSAHRQYGTANEQFSQYVIKRIRICILNVSFLRDHLSNTIDAWSNSGRQHDNQGEISVLQHYKTQLVQLLGLL